MEIQQREEIVDFYGGEEELTLLHISDVHIQWSERKLEKLKAIIFQNNPDLLVLTGDYFDIPRGARLFRDFLIDIASSYTIVFIRGNHDFFYGKRIAALLTGIPNCHCVEEFVYSFTSPKGKLYHISSWNQRDELKNNNTGRNIILIHNPEKIREKELTGIDLLLAGHLHGGQFVFFKTASGGLFPGCLAYRYCVERKQLDNTILIVSKGLGDTFPFRLNCPKEIIRIRIV